MTNFQSSNRSIEFNMTGVSINGRFLTRQPTGVDRFAFEMVAELDRLLDEQDERVSGISFELCCPQGRKNPHVFRNIPTRIVGNRGGQLWEQWDLPRSVSGDRLLLNLCNTAPAMRKNQLVTIHDVATVRVPHSYGRAFRAWYGSLIPLIYRRSRSVCTVSNFSKRELDEIYGHRDHVRVLPEGADHMARCLGDLDVLQRHGLGSRPFIFAVSSLSPHKNFAAVVRAVETIGDAGFDVVIAGGQNPRVFAGLGSELPASVKYVGYVSDEELKALYENAACFVFPSIYEGYGLPPTEAMVCGCPVLAANAASIPEVCGDAALYFDPHDPGSLAELLRRVMGDESLRGLLREKGLKRAGGLRWRDAALALTEEIRRVSA